MTAKVAIGSRLVIPFDIIGRDDVAVVGGKNAALGQLIRTLTPIGIRVPPGFAVTVDAFRSHLTAAGIADWVYDELDHLDATDTTALARTAARIRERIRGAPLPVDVRSEIAAAYRELATAFGPELDVAVRSSATAEDLPTASFAGQHDSFLNVRGEVALDDAVRRCMASLFTDRAIVYRLQHGFDHRQVGLSVGVQKMVRSDLASAGVVFTLDTESGFRDVVLITGAWGIAEALVQGRVRPDEFWVHKPTLLQGFRPIIRREIATKARKVIYSDEPTTPILEVAVDAQDQTRAVLNDDEILAVARWAVAIETEFGTPMDIEWAKDGNDGLIYIVQARPETIHAQKAALTLELYRRRDRGSVLVRGKSVGSSVGTGPVYTVLSAGDLSGFVDGSVIVSRMTDPSWEPVLRRAAAVVTDEGGRTCHAAIVSRELGIPCVVGTGNATATLRTGNVVTVSCAEGDEGLVYEGRVGFDKETIDPSTLPKPPVALLLNLANPDRAFRLAPLPVAGVGLVRIELVITSWIGIHPMALLHPERVNDASVVAAIEERTASAPTRAEFFIDRLATGVAQIAAAFYPRPVLVRFSDFKTNEYAGLLGGTAFEPVESNPMIGFRGAARYCDARYREGFALECSAIKRVRDDFGLTNVKTMIPFCRTLGEARRVLSELASNGLPRGEGGLEVYVMCEIPNNAILVDEFSALFDGFSIGSNDLTQLTLGIDRDSEILAASFSESDPGVKRLIEQVVNGAHRNRRPVGICGQAPSDDPAFAEWLVAIGIDSMSLNADSIPTVTRRLAMPAGNRPEQAHYGGPSDSTLGRPSIMPSGPAFALHDERRPPP